MTILDKLNNIIESIKKTEDKKLYESMLDLQKDAENLVNENSKLKKELRALRFENDSNNELLQLGDVYFLKSEEFDLDGPFCLKCWDERHELVKLHVTGGFDYSIGSCPKCGYVASYIEQRR